MSEQIEPTAPAPEAAPAIGDTVTFHGKGWTRRQMTIDSIVEAGPAFAADLQARGFEPRQFVLVGPHGAFAFANRVTRSGAFVPAL